MMLKLGALTLAGATALLADCSNGGRLTTAAEKEHYLETVAALKRALPAAPPGWQLQDGNRIVQAPTNVCNGSDPSRAWYSVRYTWVEGLKQQNQRHADTAKKLAALRALPPAALAELNQLSLKNRALMRELPKARAAGNTAEVERLNSEMRQLVDRSAELRRKHEASIQPQVDAITQQAIANERGSSFHVGLTLAVNETQSEIERNLSGGDVAVLREEKITRVVFGAPGRAGDLRVVSVTAKFEGAPEHVDVIVNAWDTTPLKTLLEGSRNFKASLD